MDSVSTATPRAHRLEAEALAYAGLAFSSFGWASAFIAGKFVLAEMTPLPVAACRYAIAAAVLLPFAGRSFPIHALRRSAAPLAVMIVCGGVLYQWVFLSALARTSATNTALLIALNPVFTILLAPLIGEALTRRRAVGVTLALLGAVTVITKGELRHLTVLSFNAGDLLALVAAMLWASVNLASRGVMRHLTPALTNCLMYGVGGVALSFLAAAEHPWAQLAAASPAALGGLLVLAVVSSVLAGQFFLVGIRAVGVSRTVVFVYLVPVLTAVLSVLLLHESFYIAQAIGGAAVLAGVYYCTSVRAAR